MRRDSKEPADQCYGQIRCAHDECVTQHEQQYRQHERGPSRHLQRQTGQVQHRIVWRLGPAFSGEKSQVRAWFTTIGARQWATFVKQRRVDVMS
ncbi:hypothetical protein [Streptomyces fuscichromogenes]|uniref:Uncharacterized protein n=1 Tax=Streptomyces fuscichromogenes TaxID=1324013 RepID=A0A917X9R3_9ACTN|nr:hypothetical protein [Streptomyces fuscichromogenes]GGM97958.1 hypothetical protein GCM10011578_018610 [Streptomyces fuscichromogenes]